MTDFRAELPSCVSHRNWHVSCLQCPFPERKKETERTKGEDDEDGLRECRRKRFAPVRLSRLSIFFLHLIIKNEL
jgi:hypothetical protein